MPVSGGGWSAQQDMDVTPMLDVLLTLLVIFMAGVVRWHRTMDAQLPRPCPAICERMTPIVLQVLPAPRYVINGVDVERGALGARLRAIYDARPEKILQLSGSAGVSYQQVIDAMDVAHSAGVRVIGLAGRETATGR